MFETQSFGFLASVCKIEKQELLFKGYAFADTDALQLFMLIAISIQVMASVVDSDTSSKTDAYRDSDTLNKYMVILVLPKPL